VILSAAVTDRPGLISSLSLKLNRRLHRRHKTYGIGGGRHAARVCAILATLPSDATVLDFGCGKGRLQQALDFPIAQYDPAVRQYAAVPDPADLVVCTDVLEHVEPDRLLAVLTELRRCVRRVGYFVIHTGPSSKTLADGRNAHLIQRDAHWWRRQLKQFFRLARVHVIGRAVSVEVTP
jgi:cyclopropane fatty-acyl-phospholipid synthase-like methyltransferase